MRAKVTHGIQVIVTLPKRVDHEKRYEGKQEKRDRVMHKRAQTPHDHSDECAQVQHN